jgi:hypothetical protein
MVASLLDFEAPDTTALTSPRLEFARNSFNQTQDLIRFMDQKAFFILSAVGMLTTGLGVFSSIILSLVPRSAWHGGLGLAGGALALLYLAVAFAVVLKSSSVFTPRTGSPAGGFPSHNLFFLPASAPSVQRDQETYISKLTLLDHDAVLADYATSTARVSAIYQVKERYVNAAIFRFRALCLVWMATIVMLLVAVVMS